mmetsp:Transcript_41971/g.61683  ORF Transcript_41971/g.61683 Transcript_41971/m.61683 type:complete len:298 (-) Transcript_41971:621-1514(-)
MQDMMYGTEDLDVHSKMDDAARAIQAHPAVIQFSQRNTTRTGCLGTSKATGFQVTPQCYKSGGCGTKQEQVIITQSCTTLCACVEELRSRIEERHGSDCVKAVQAFNSAQETSTAAEGLLASSAPHVMMWLSIATLRAATANKVALEAEQEKDAAEKEKEDLQRELCRPEASTIEVNEEMPADVGDLDLADWRRHATKWWNRFQVQLGSREDALAPRTGKNGYVDHPRLGLIGCLAYWARGSTIPCDHIVAGATRARVCAAEGMVQPWVGGGPWRCQVVHALSSQCGRRATLLWSQK